MNEVCQLTSDNYECVCDEGYTMEDAVCHQNCDLGGIEVDHGESTSDGQLCQDGVLLLLCEAEGIQFQHGETYNMADDVIRVCDQGVMKPQHRKTMFSILSLKLN